MIDSGDELRIKNRAKFCTCRRCKRPIEGIFDYSLRDAHEECGGDANPEWQDEMRKLAHYLKQLRKQRGIG